MLSGALRWTGANLEWFAPRRWQEHLPPRAFGPGPLLELLGLVRVLERSGLLPLDAELPMRALDLAEEAAHTEEFARGMGRCDELFPYHLNLVGLLECLGRPQGELRKRGETLLAAGAGGHALPYKPVLNRIELRYFTDRAGFTAPATLAGLGALYGQSIAALGPDVLQLTESEVYAFTHVLFYVTDFGRHRPFPGGRADSARLRETVRVLLGVHLARGGLDLLAELLLCDAALEEEEAESVEDHDLAYGAEAGPGTGPGTGTGPGPRTGSGAGSGTGSGNAPGTGPGSGTGSGAGSGPGEGSGFLVNAAWNALASAARPDGSVPSPVHRPDVLAGLTGDKAAAYVFGTCYHTTLAAALASGVALAAGRRDSRPGERAGVPCAVPPLPLPRSEPGEIRQWVRAACEVPGAARPGEPGAWPGYLASLLVLAVQARDPDVLAEVLSAAERLGHGDESLVRSASALLAAWNG
ncbi:hypothetical protein [Streptomyces sp. WMMB 322]|uniref:DUF6895 family protein n=1 Tax=Streptomyces sp. WMMB 322 TaxID=1286821 RepID=UPI00131DC94E|nr:hypothetical protein [Streptomyces sp. WMMB 322]